MKLKEEEKYAVAWVKKIGNIELYAQEFIIDEVLMKITKEEFMKSQIMISMKTINPLPEQYELLHQKKAPW